MPPRLYAAYGTRTYPCRARTRQAADPREKARERRAPVFGRARADARRNARDRGDLGWPSRRQERARGRKARRRSREGRPTIGCAEARARAQDARLQSEAGDIRADPPG